MGSASGERSGRTSKQNLPFEVPQSLRTRGQSLILVLPADSPSTDALRLAGVQTHLDVVETLAEALGEVPGTADLG